MRRRRWMLAGLLAGALALAGGGVVLAQSAGTDGDSFLDRVARKLGIEPEQLQTAIRDTRNEDIDAAVARGDLTQEQADRLKEKLDQLPDDFGHGPFGPGSFGPPFAGPPPEGFPFERKHFEFDGPGHERFGFGFGFGLPGSLDDLAAFLGIPADQLRDQLAADGATLGSVAETHGKSRDDLKSFITGNVQERLDQAVADGKLTAEHASDIRAKLDAMLDDVIDQGFGDKRFHFEFRHRLEGGGDHAGPNSPAAPDATPGTD